MSKVPRYFVLLEITDPTVNAFLWSVRNILAGSRRRRQSPVHLTVRGPYDSHESKEAALKTVCDGLKRDVLQISGVGRFSNPGEEVVYFRVDSPNLRSVWWKPEFPIERYGYEPHISVYRGPDAALADRAAAFLRDEKIVMNCAEFRIVWYESRQPDLFSVFEPAIGDMDLLMDSTRVDGGLLDRLTEAVDALRFHRPRRTGTR